MSDSTFQFVVKRIKLTLSFASLLVASMLAISCNSTPVLKEETKPAEVKTLRSAESIRKVMEPKKEVIFRIYSTNPAVDFRLTFELIIHPSGDVKLSSFETDSPVPPELINQIRNELLTLHFGPSENAPTKAQYTMNFFSK